MNNACLQRFIKLTSCYRIFEQNLSFMHKPYTCCIYFTNERLVAATVNCFTECRVSTYSLDPPFGRHTKYHSYAACLRPLGPYLHSMRQLLSVNILFASLACHVVSRPLCMHIPSGSHGEKRNSTKFKFNLCQSYKIKEVYLFQEHY